MSKVEHSAGRCCCGRSMDHRREFMYGLVGLADFLSAHPAAPVPLVMQADVYLDGVGSDDTVRAFGSLYNAELNERDQVITATKDFGPVSYNLIHITGTASVRSGDAA